MKQVRFFCQPDGRQWHHEAIQEVIAPFIPRVGMCFFTRYQCTLEEDGQGGDGVPFRYGLMGLYCSMRFRWEESEDGPIDDELMLRIDSTGRWCAGVQPYDLEADVGEYGCDPRRVLALYYYASLAAAHGHDHGLERMAHVCANIFGVIENDVEHVHMCYRIPKGEE
jgi:hypothetical protein